MDLSKFSNRKRAEDGARLQLKHPDTGELLTDDDGNKVCVIVRGTASKSVQAKLRAHQLSQMKSVDEGEDKKAAEVRIMEDVHNDLCETAKIYIIGFENATNEHGEQLTVDDAQWFLDLTFPVVEVEVDKDEKPIIDENGEPKFKMTNNPFAKQVTEFASKGKNFLGNGLPS